MTKEDLRNTLERIRERLLDLTFRNRLLNYQDKGAKVVKVIDELPNVVFDHLVNKNKPMWLVPLDNEPIQLALPGSGDTSDDGKAVLDDALLNIQAAITDDKAEADADIDSTANELPDASSKAERHHDDDLQTDLSWEAYDGRLRRIYNDHKTYIASTGSNLLFIALGFLKWYDPNNEPDKPRLAPLILVPINMQYELKTILRGEKNKPIKVYRYKVTYSGEDINTNISLQHRLLRPPFNYKMPPIDLADEFDPEEYFSEISDFIEKIDSPAIRNWQVLRTIRIGFFTFAKDVMYRDLDPALWPEDSLFQNEHLLRLLGGADAEPRMPSLSDDVVEELQATAPVPIVLDADGSQIKVLSRVRKGENLVVQGPPGTGKSQTIANIIAGALHDGKTVLFMAQKNAAISVVKDSLTKAGLGGFCLELHSTKADKAHVVEQINTHFSDEPAGYLENDYVEKELRATNNQRGQISGYRNVLLKSVDDVGMPFYQLLWRYEQAKQGLYCNNEGLEAYIASHPPPALRIAGLVGAGEIETLVEKLRELGDYHSNMVPEKGRVWDKCAFRNVDIDTPKYVEADLLSAIASLQDIEIHASALPGSLFEDLPTAHISVVAKNARTLVPPKQLLQFVCCNIIHGVCSKEQYKLYADLLDRHEALMRTIPPNISSGPLELQHVARAEKAVNALQHLSFNNVSDISSAIEALNGVKQAIDSAGQLQNVLNGLETVTGQSVASLSHDDLQRLLELAETVISIPDEHKSAFLQMLRLRTLHSVYVRFAMIIDEVCEMRKQIDGVLVFEDCPADDELAELRKSLRELQRAWYRWWPFGSVAMTKAAGHRIARKGVDVLSDGFIDALSTVGKYRTAYIAFNCDAEFSAIFGVLFRGVESDAQCIMHYHDIVVDLQNKYSDDELARVGLVLTSLSKPHCRALIAKASEYLSNTHALIDRTFVGLNRDKYSSMRNRERITELTYLANIIDRDIQDVASINVDQHLRFLDVEMILKDTKDLCECRIKIETMRSLPAFVGNVNMATSPAILQSIEWMERIAEIGVGKGLLPWLFDGDAVERHKQFSGVLNNMEAAHGRLKVAITHLKTFADIRSGTVFDPDAIMTLDVAASELQEAIKAAPFIDRYNRYSLLKSWFVDKGYGEFLRYLQSAPLKPECFTTMGQMSFDRQAIVQVYKAQPILHNVSASLLDQVKQKYCEQDRSITDKYKKAIRHRAWAGHESLPGGIKAGRVSELTEGALIRHVQKKPQARLTTRELVRRSGDFLMSAMPCWMMGPGSVAQYLAPGMRKFDLLIIDEASQVRPEDALGSFARAKQLVIVGDSKQMPPSEFFNVVSSSNDDDTVVPAEQLESILDLCATNYNNEQLRWHYRSRHETLIQFSNDRYYDNSLILPPSAIKDSPELGVKYQYCDNATFHDEINEVEATAMVDYLASFVKKQASIPRHRQRSIGIVVMNIRQKELIQEIYDKAILGDEKVGYAVENYNPSEPILITNLENVQGDQRDVIAIGFTYGPNLQSRKVHQNFGPVNREGGHRRLNVLFTRAKYMIQVFTSMRSSEIKDEPGSPRGMRDMRAYLEYAESGGVLKDPGYKTGRGPDSSFEESVSGIINKMGLEPVYQVGVGKFRIDIGVLNPKSPGRYLCGIECDGARYHCDPVTRDRDRLRQEILESRGWNIYRIWSTDWLKNRDNEISRLGNYLTAKLAQTTN